MIGEETYGLMKKLVNAYESGKCSYVITIDREYNPNYGDDKLCKCGHSYCRHFDSYEGMESVGCKYCGCYHFELSIEEIREEKLNELGI
jgi:hypothetical protein